VLERAPNREGIVYWRVKCDCGKEWEVSRNNLHGMKSCGCAARKDLTGQRFNKLTVLSRAYLKNGGSFWNVRCDCGVEKVVMGSNLARTLSCGCMNYKNIPLKDHVGEKYGMLLVESRVGYVYTCLCECGTKKEIDANSLSGYFSCGCAKNLMYSLSRLSWIIKDYKSNADNRGLRFELSNARVEELVRGNCHYCGFSLSEVRPDLQQFAFNGIDRLDNSKGYESGNVVPCCKVCNHAKGGMTESEFTAWAIKVADFQRKGLLHPK
jgi:hypothetical protein